MDNKEKVNILIGKIYKVIADLHRLQFKQVESEQILHLNLLCRKFIKSVKGINNYNTLSQKNVLKRIHKSMKVTIIGE